MQKKLELIAHLNKHLVEHEQGLEAYQEEYRKMLDDDDASQTIAELIGDLDYDSDDFNLGYEQGYMSGMRTIIRLVMQLK